MSTTTERLLTEDRRARPRRRRSATYPAFLLPVLALFTACITIPAAMGIFYSFTDSVGPGEFSFVGFANYAVMFTDPAILRTYGFTIGVALCSVALVNVLALALAFGLTSRIRGRTVLRTIFVLPMVVSGIIIAFVFRFIFSNTLPNAATALGIAPLEESLLANPATAWLTIVLVTAFQFTPQAMLIYIAGLLTIPAEVTEAAALDGANGWRQFRSITLPLVSGYVLINAILGFKDFLSTYDIVVGLTDGGPGTATVPVTMSIFRGFQNGDYAYQMANSTIFFLIALTIALVQLRVTRGKVQFA